MNSYYLTLVFKNELGEKERKALLSEILKKIDKIDAKGLSVKEEDWGIRDLAYPIKRENKGYYIHLQFETEPKNVKDLDKLLKVEEDILRYLLVRR